MNCGKGNGICFEENEYFIELYRTALEKIQKS